MSELLLQERLRAEAERRPSAPAVVMGQSTLTYAELDEASTRLGRMLRDLGCEHGDRVCMVMPKSPLSLVALYGILKAGCVYVPIDVTSPSARAGKIVTPCEPRVILYGRGSESIIDGLTRDNPVAQSAAMGWMDEAPVPDDVAPAFTMEDVDGLDASPLSYPTRPDEPAYILYTSGSTGSPKGVVISHASVEAFGEWCVRYFAIGSSERISSHPEYHFDLSVLDIYTALYSGAALHLVPPEANLLPGALAAFIRDEELTQWCSVPSVLNYMAKFDAVRQDDFPALKRVVWCGEVFPTPQLIHWMERLPHVEFTNLYGPTEATCASSYYTLPSRPESPTDAVPIGVACDGEELLVLDEARHPVPPGTIGELYIGGVGLSLGYWRDEETTSAAFIDDVQVGDRRVRLYRTGDLARVGEDGLVYFAGRADTQVKSRGYRIELGEIEAALSTLACLKESAVVAIDSPGFEGKAICCAYAPAQGVSVTHGELRSQLSEHVPKYMLPAHWKAWETLPKNENGKIDRPLLRREFQNE